MTIQLNDDLIDFFSDIKIKFEWNDKFYINIMDFFPMLKKGVVSPETCYMAILIYGLINDIININDIKSNSRLNTTIKICNSNNKLLKNCEILCRNFCGQLPELNQVDDIVFY